MQTGGILNIISRYSYLLVIFPILLLAGLFFLSKVTIRSEQALFDKVELQTTLARAIGNQADPETIVYIFQNRNEIKRSLGKTIFDDNSSDSYGQDVTLYQVLMDIKVSIYAQSIDPAIIAEPENRDNFLGKLDFILAEVTNRSLTDTDYNLNSFDAEVPIESAEFKKVDSLLRQYLAEARWGYRIAIGAMSVSVATLFLALGMVRKNRRRKL